MNMLSFLAGLRRDRRGKAKAPQRRAVLQVESLEGRQLLTCSSISGYVFHDLNNNGIYDSTEGPLANSKIELRNANNVVVGTAVTNAQGFYRFETDTTISTAPTTRSHSLTFADARTNSTQAASLPQFDPALGTLLAVEITITGHITSDIKVENLDPTGGTVTATVAGNLNVTGPRFATLVTTSTDAQRFNATGYDGTLDYGGRSGVAFGEKTVNGTSTKVLTDTADLAPYLGTGTLTLNAIAQASSSAQGGGNLSALISSRGGAQVTVVYRYIPNNCLRAGNYVIVQTGQPAGYLDGRESRNGTLVANSVGNDAIPVTVATSDVTDNNFAELGPGVLAGYVYHDRNNNGLKDANEAGIRAVAVTLTGFNDLGQAVSQVMKTGANGLYQFAGLRPGTYALKETHPLGYLDGKDSLGGTGGTVANDQFAEIGMRVAGSGANYNFGELLPVSLGGFVYLDANKNGRKDRNETGIARTVVTLTGTNDLGNTVRVVKKTAGNGSYLFSGLRPGKYVLTETQPRGYADGKEALGTAGGVLGSDQFTDIVLASGVTGNNYNFGENQRTPVRPNDHDPDPSKTHFLASSARRGRRR